MWIQMKIKLTINYPILNNPQDNLFFNNEHETPIQNNQIIESQNQVDLKYCKKIIKVLHTKICNSIKYDWTIKIKSTIKIMIMLEHISSFP